MSTIGVRFDNGMTIDIEVHPPRDPLCGLCSWKAMTLSCSVCGSWELVDKDPTGGLHACSNEKCSHTGKARAADCAELRHLYQ